MPVNLQPLVESLKHVVLCEVNRLQTANLNDRVQKHEQHLEHGDGCTARVAHCLIRILVYYFEQQEEAFLVSRGLQHLLDIFAALLFVFADAAAGQGWTAGILKKLKQAIEYCDDLLNYKRIILLVVLHEIEQWLHRVV